MLNLVRSALRQGKSLQEINVADGIFLILILRDEL